MCCVLTDVFNIFPVPVSAPGTWASVLTMTPYAWAAVCSCLIPRLCADSPPRSDMYFFSHISRGSADPVCFRAERAHRGRSFLPFPHGNLWGGWNMSAVDLWREQWPQVGLRSPSPRGGEPVLSHHLEMASEVQRPPQSDLPSSDRSDCRTEARGRALLSVHATEVRFWSLITCLWMWESGRAADNRCLYIYTLLSGGCFQILNVFGAPHWEIRWQ